MPMRRCRDFMAPWSAADRACSIDRPVCRSRQCLTTVAAMPADTCHPVRCYCGILVLGGRDRDLPVRDGLALEEALSLMPFFGTFNS